MFKRLNARIAIWSIGWLTGLPFKQINRLNNLNDLKHLRYFDEMFAIGLPPANYVRIPYVNVPPAHRRDTSREPWPPPFYMRICQAIGPRIQLCDACV